MSEIERERQKRVASATFRLSAGVFQALQKEADKQDTSLNTLVNQVFDAHVSDRIFLERLDFLRLTKLTFRRILDGTSDQALVEAGKSAGRETVRTVTLARGGEMTPEGVSETVCKLAEFARGMRYSEIKSNGKRVVVLTHDLGPKWSIFIGSFMGAVFKLIGCEPEITSDDDCVVVEINSAMEESRHAKDELTPRKREVP